jgi:hypothetical protein
VGVVRNSISTSFLQMLAVFYWRVVFGAITLRECMFLKKYDEQVIIIPEHIMLHWFKSE